MTNLVTIIMPVYNGASFLEKSINSILFQSFKDYQFFIIDDGSTDNSKEIINKYASLDKRIKYFYKSNSGITDTLNYGLNLAKTKWIARLDVDDFSSPSRLMTQLRIVNKNKSIVLCGSNIINVDAHGNYISHSKYPKDNKKLFYRLIHGKPFFAHSSAFFSREAAIQVGGYRTDIKKAQDWDLWIRISTKGQLFCSNKYLTYISRHKNQISSSSFEDQLLFSKLAIVSFLVSKKYQSNDPMLDFLNFKNWLKNLPEYKSLLKNYLFIKNLKIKYVKISKLKRIFLLINLFFSCNFYIFIKRYLFGDNLGFKISKLWISKNN